MLFELFYTFFLLGAFTFGGGYAMLPLIQEEVLKHGWLTLDEVVNFIAISESTPGPFAINMSTFVGVRTRGILGAFFSTLGVVVPSFVIILIIAKLFEKFKDNKTVKSIMRGLKPAVVGLIASAILKIFKTVFYNKSTSIKEMFTTSFFVSLVIFVTMLIFTFKKKIHPILIILISAVIGIIAGYAFNLPI